MIWGGFFRWFEAVLFGDLRRFCSVICDVFIRWFEAVLFGDLRRFYSVIWGDFFNYVERKLLFGGDCKGTFSVPSCNIAFFFWINLHNSGCLFTFAMMKETCIENDRIFMNYSSWKIYDALLFSHPGFFFNLFIYSFLMF